MISDYRLIKKYLNGENTAFEELYSRHKNRIYSYIHRLLGIEYNSSVDDIYQQTWIKAIDRFHKYRDTGNFNSWMLRIAHNLFIDLCRKNKVKFSELPEIIDLKDIPCEELIKTEQDIELNECIERLSPDMKSVVLLRQQNISFKEIAKIQNTSINTALSRMSYALKSLKKMLSSEQR